MKQMIKNILVLSLLLLGLSINLEGQTMVWKETPKGSDVKAYTDYTEWNAEDKKYWTEFATGEFPNATLIDSASRLYNCHWMGIAYDRKWISEWGFTQDL